MAQLSAPSKFVSNTIDKHTRSGLYDLVYQDLSDTPLTVEERKFLCEEIRGVHNLLKLVNVAAIEKRYKIPRTTVSSWLKRFDADKPMFEFSGNPFAIGEEELVKISNKLIEARTKRTPLCQHELNALMLVAAQATGVKRKVTTYLRTDSLDSRTRKFYKAENQVIFKN